MPEGSRGPRGYADWQRIQNYDGPVVFNTTATSHEGIFRPFLRTGVDRYSHLSGFIEVGENPVLCTLGWWTAAESAKVLQLRQFVIDPLVTEAPYLHIPHQGPFLEIELEPLTGATHWKLTSALAFSNRVFGLEFVPRYPVLVSHAFAFVAEENLISYPRGYYAGPARLDVTNNAAVETAVLIEAETAPGTWVEVDRMSFGASVERQANVLL